MLSGINEVENNDLKPKRPSSAKSTRKKSMKLRNRSNSPPLPQPPDTPNTQLPSGKNLNKSPRKVSFQDNLKSIENPNELQATINPLKFVDASTSIDLNLTRLSRIHRFIQTDVNSTEYNNMLNQITELKTQLEEKEKIILEIKIDESVSFVYVFYNFYNLQIIYY